MDRPEKRRVTVYFMGGFGGSVRAEASAFAHSVGPYAQHKSAVHYSLVRKGERRTRGLVQTYMPSLVVLDGWGHPDPEGHWIGGWSSKLDEYIASSCAVVVCDYRGHDCM
jgi:hypothetical protein